jgi:WhiB family redox-sensing transcriptional regulator
MSRGTPRIGQIELPPVPEFVGLCAEVDPELFFPEKGSSAGRAKALCRRCPEVVECLRWAMDHDERGIWGATSDRQRERMRRSA